MEGKKLTLERWITGAVSATEPAELKKTIMPLHQNVRGKADIIYFIIGVVQFVDKKLRELLSAQKDFQTATVFAESEAGSLSDNKTEKGLQDTAAWLEAAGADPEDVPGSMMLGLLFTQRFRAQQLLQEIGALKADIRYANTLETLYPVEDIFQHIAMERQVPKSFTRK